MNVKQLERQVAELSAGELREFSAWFEQYMANEWDRQIEQDSVNGGIDRLVRSLGIDLDDPGEPMEEGFRRRFSANGVAA
jgi:hypothetical protein